MNQFLSVLFYLIVMLHFNNMYYVVTAVNLFSVNL